MMKPKEFFSVWKNVFSKRNYLLASVLTFLVFYSLNVVIRNFSILNNFLFQRGFFPAVRLFLTLFMGLWETMTTSSFIIMIFLGLSLGMFISLVAYKTKMLRSVSDRNGIFTTAGIFLGILAPGCAACGVGLLSVFGISAAVLAFLPFRGLEISILAVGFLLFSIAGITKNVKKGIVCEIKPKKNLKKKEIYRKDG